MQKLPPVAGRFIEDFGLSLASQGFSRTAGRLLGLILMLDDGGDLESLAAHLRVSRASVSTNSRLLESIGAIERHSVPGRRRMVYRASRGGVAGGEDGAGAREGGDGLAHASDARCRPRGAT